MWRAASPCNLKLRLEDIMVYDTTLRDGGQATGVRFTREQKEGMMLLDVPAVNKTAGTLLEKHGFAVRGFTVFMGRGKLPDLRIDNVFAFASLGSMG